MNELDHFTYNPETGSLWNTRADCEVGFKARVNGKRMKKLRLCWLVHTGKLPTKRYVIPKDNDHTNTKWENLMESDRPMPPVAANEQDWVISNMLKGAQTKEINTIEFLENKLIEAFKENLGKDLRDDFLAFEDEVLITCNSMLHKVQGVMNLLDYEDAKLRGYSEERWEERYNIDRHHTPFLGKTGA